MQVDQGSGFSFTRIRAFLQETKGMRSVKVENYSTDLKLFLDSAKLFMKSTDSIRQPTFTDQESFRLKKVLQKVRAQIAGDE